MPGARQAVFRTECAGLGYDGETARAQGIGQGNTGLKFPHEFECMHSVSGQNCPGSFTAGKDQSAYLVQSRRDETGQ